MRRAYSGLLLFLTSCILPGIGYMYLGLIKRGLFFLSAFFGVIFITSSFGMGFLGLIIPIMWITCIFDGFNKMRMLRNGEYVEDDIRDIKNFCHKYKSLILVVLGIGLALWAFNFGIGFIFSGSYHLAHTVRRFAPIILIAIGVFVLFRKRNTDKNNIQQ